MKRLAVFLLCLLLVLSLSSCIKVVLPQQESKDTAAPQGQPTETPSSASAEPATPSPAVTPAPSPAATPANPTPKAPALYSSYAHLISYDPKTGIAQFDYFDILKGDDAVKYLVENEGYSQAEAQALVDDFADSEFVEKNTNPALRAIDIDGVSLKLMYQPSGKLVPGAEAVPSSTGDFNKIYKLDPSLLLDSYPYYIHVSSAGQVSLIEQIYWP